MRTYNIKETYVDEEDPWFFILSAADFAILLTENRLRGYSPGQLVFGQDVVFLIKHTLDWELLCSRKTDTT